VEAYGVDGHGADLLRGWWFDWTGGQATRPKPPVQETFSLAARVSCRKPTASSSRARFSAPASMTFNPPEAKMSASVALASASSPAIRTVVVSGPTVPAARVPAKVVLNALSTLDCGSAAAISAAAE